MKYYGQIRDSKIVEVIPEFNPIFPGVPIEDRYAPDFLALCVEVPEGTEEHWLVNDDGTFSAPPPSPEPFVPVVPILEAPQTLEERVENLEEAVDTILTDKGSTP